MNSKIQMSAEIDSQTSAEEIKTKKEKDEVQVTVSLEHEAKLQKLLKRVSDGFDMARVTRKQVLAHIIDAAFDKFQDDDVYAIRRSTITDMSLFELEIREIRRTGVMPDALKEYLWNSRHMTWSPKRVKKTKQDAHSNAIQSKQEAA